MSNDFILPFVNDARLRAIASFFCIVFIIWGLMFVLLYVLPIFKPAIESCTWPAVDGKVTKSSIIGIGGGASRPLIEFQYDVAGTTYRTEAIWTSDNLLLSSRDRSENIVRRYPPGASIAVYHDPFNPELALLQRGIHGTALYCFCFGATLFAAGLFVVWFFRSTLVRYFSRPSDK